MHRRALLLVALALLTVPLTGCIGGMDAGDTNQTEEAEPASANQTDLGTLPDGSPVPTETRLSACSEQLGVFPVPAPLYENAIPEGFEPASFDPAGETIPLVVISLSCSLDGDEDHGEVWGLLEVHPPEELAPPGDATSLVVLGAITSTETQAAVYEAWGMGSEVLAGDVTIETPNENPVSRAGHVLASDGDFTLHMYSAVEGEPSPETSGEARAFGVEGGEVSGIMDVSWTDSNHGFETGEAALAVEGDGPAPFTAPQGTGLAVHYWGQDYQVTFEHVEPL